MNPSTNELLAEIRDLSHEGLGIASVKGKTVFIEGALPSELVNFTYVKKKSKFDIGKTTKILRASPIRTEPPCPYFGVCGGCALQHMTGEAQSQMKQNLLLKQLYHFGSVVPEEILVPIHGPIYHYRRRARLGVQINKVTNQIELGYKEKSSHQLVSIEACTILEPPLSTLIPKLKTILNRLSIRSYISEIELVKGDQHIAIVLRHSKAPSEQDRNVLIQFAEQHNVAIYLQSNLEKRESKKEDVCQNAILLWSPQGLESEYLSYTLTAFNISLQFHPLDFIQVNAEVNVTMVSKVMELFDLSSSDRILDLYCGLGNFTLPLATKAGHVIGIEGSARLVERGFQNAKLNGIQNIEFYKTDLGKPLTNQAWLQKQYDKILLDPPRTGAFELIKVIPQFKAKKIIYISCDPATMARDIGVLVKNGYRLQSVGILDMFPQTKHVESLALLSLDPN